MEHEMESDETFPRCDITKWPTSTVACIEKLRRIKLPQLAWSEADAWLRGLATHSKLFDCLINLCYLRDGLTFVTRKLVVDWVRTDLPIIQDVLANVCAHDTVRAGLVTEVTAPKFVDTGRDLFELLTELNM